MSESFAFDDVTLFTAGTVGEPGARVFYLQAAADSVVVTVKCEKQQVGALAEFLTGVISDLPPTEPDPGPHDLVEPILAEWIAGTMSVAYDDGADRIVLVVEELGDDSAADPDAAAPDPASLRVRLTRGQVAAYVELATELVSGGRPPCPLCGHPMGADHACPRTNGHGPPR